MNPFANTSRPSEASGVYPPTVDALNELWRAVPERLYKAEGCQVCQPQKAGELAVRFVNVHKSFGSLRVLTGLNLDIKLGETTVILGPSGTGKSVLIRHLNGLIKPDAGEVWCCGMRVDTASERQLMPLRQWVGYLFQLGALFDSMTVGDNVAFPLQEHTDLKRREREALAARALELVGLPGIANKHAGDLSGGQQRRVAMARSIVLRPSLMLYDEPTTGLDPVTADLIGEVIATLTRELGITGIMVTHDMTCARKVGDRFVLLSGGKVQVDADPEAFLANKNPFLQRFVAGKADEVDLEAIRRAFARG